MPLDLDPATREALMTRIRFCRDLGLTEFYRRPVDPALLAQLATESEELSNQRTPSFRQPLDERVGNEEPLSASLEYPVENQPLLPHQPIQNQPQVAPANRDAALQLIRDEIGECTRCPLHQGRNKIVFGDGDPNARLMFVGEGPGADEDAQGVPFVGKAGQLLNNMIAAMGLKREEVYIANVVKCRPPGNRVPEQVEGDTWWRWGPPRPHGSWARASRWPVCAGGCIQCGVRSSSSPTTPLTCSVSPARRRRPGPTCKLP